MSEPHETRAVAPSETHVELERVTMQFGDRTVFRGVNAQIPRGKITVVTKITATPFEFEVKSIVDAEVDPSIFENPETAGLEKIDRNKIAHCAQCQKRVEKSRALWIRARGGKKFFCDLEHKKKYTDSRRRPTPSPQPATSQR